MITPHCLYQDESTDFYLIHVFIFLGTDTRLFPAAVFVALHDTYINSLLQLQT